VGTVAGGDVVGGAVVGTVAVVVVAAVVAEVVEVDGGCVARAARGALAHEDSPSATTPHSAAVAARPHPRLGCATVPRRWRTPSALLVICLLPSGVLAACSSTPDAARRQNLPVPAQSPTAAATTTSPAPPSTATLPPSPATTDTRPAAAHTTVHGFVGTVSDVTASQVSATWRPGCPVGPPSLRLLTMRYWGFDGHPHTGTMVVAAAVTHAVLEVFGTLFAEHFPIRQMQPEDAYGGQDPASMAADNTSGFNCRDAVAPGPPAWSVHAFGEAIDVNPVENPYIEGGQLQPAQGAAYADRADVRPGMAVPGGELVAAFASVGWQWGGRWTASPDYQHFSATGG